MHIMEGFLPHPWWEIWFALSLPVVAFGVYKMNKMIKENRETLPLLAVAGAFVFVLSSLKLPSVTGSCSHPTGTGMGSIIFGPWITSVLAVIVLVYQAVFLAHGRPDHPGGKHLFHGHCRAGHRIPGLQSRQHEPGCISTWRFSWRRLWPTGPPISSHPFSWRWPFRRLPVACSASFEAFAAVFAITQIPLAIVEGMVTALMFKYIVQLRSDVLVRMNVVSQKHDKKAEGGCGMKRELA